MGDERSDEVGTEENGKEEDDGGDGESGEHEADVGEEQEEDQVEVEETEVRDQNVNTRNIGNGDATVYASPFSEFPPLRHHAHPFFVIQNALPKLRAAEAMTPEQTNLLALMTLIEGNWLRRLPSRPLSNPRKQSRKRPRPVDGFAGDDDGPPGGSKRPVRRATGQANLKLTGTRKPKTRGAHDNVNRGQEGKSRKDGNGETQPAQQSPYPTPFPNARLATVDTSDEKTFLFDDASEISAWRDAVAAAGPPEKVDETVIWSDKERVRPPIQNWERWHVPYKQPTQHARFSSSDWSMYLYAIPLWMPPYKK